MPAVADWQPDLYRQFETERTWPARDLLARVAAESLNEIADLGCGPGNSTELLRSCFPEARLTGVDRSEAMLAAARERMPQTTFLKDDVAGWAPDRPLDLIFANAVLQWVPDHPALFRRLFGLLVPGGVLAAQMPDNLDEPTHRLMREVAETGPWKDRIGSGAEGPRARSILDISAYYDLLAGQAAGVEVWRTVYHHPMASVAAIVDWLRSTGLRPFLEPLTATERFDFLQAYQAALVPHYPQRLDGRVLLAFPRIFIVARRAIGLSGP